jgi:lipopolysaccharide/colanic/teichoic acid biosynthesis glycosyltransferase
MIRRVLDIVCSVAGLIVLAPLLALLCFLIYRQDRYSPFYIAPRTGRRGRPYKMVKLRSMVIRADSNKVDSTAANDPRITSVGRFVRRLKLDEVPQLWNVLKGEMSLVGPRPNVKRETDLYTDEERRLLSIRPGITDLASIVFADEGDILEGKPDPDLAYNQLIRPWKSRLGLIYVDQPSVRLYFECIYLTIVSALNRPAALAAVCRILQRLGASPELVEIARRDKTLNPAPPPGASEIVSARG